MNELEFWQAWLVLSAVLIGAELFIGSPMFVLLILGGASLVASGAAWLGAPLWGQFLLATATGALGYLAARRVYRGQPQGATLPLDIGARVTVVRHLSDLHAEVSYRGAIWAAESDQPGIDWQAPLYVKDVRGNTLIVTPDKQR